MSELKKDLKTNETFDIRVGAQSFENMKRLHSNDDKFTILINDFSVELPVNVAASISSKITDFLIMDSTTRSFDIIMDFRNPENITKIVPILSSQSPVTSCQIKSKNDAMDFAEFGYRLGNEEFIIPLRKFVNEISTANINPSNVIERIEEKDLLAQINDESADISKETAFIEKNFSEVCKNKSFIKWCQNEKNSSIVEEIVSSSDLKLESEDELLSFIIGINREYKFTNLLSYVHLEFCSIEKCREFLDYINCDEFFQSKLNRKSVIQCLSNRILYDNSSSHDFTFCKSRFGSILYNKIVGNNAYLLKDKISQLNSIIKYKDNKISQLNSTIKDKDNKISQLNSTIKDKDNKISQLNSTIKDKDNITEIYLKDDPFNGILKREHAKNNVLMKSTERYNNNYEYDVYNLLSDVEEKVFYSKNEKNSYFQASLKDRKTFTINKYAIKGSRNYGGLKKWKLEGQRCSDGSWVLLHDYSGSNLNAREVRQYPVSCRERLKAVRFTQDGPNKDNDYELILGSFEIFGILYN